MSSTRHWTPPRTKTSGDVVDAALTRPDEISSQLAEVESRELANIDNALEQMRDGRYGICETCETTIPLARLQALPYATLCIQCQREAEKAGTAGGGAYNWGRIFETDSGDNDVVFNDLELDVP